jgi:hypothetical protein
MMLQGVWFSAALQLQGYLFESQLTQVSVSVPKALQSPPNVETQQIIGTLRSVFLPNQYDVYEFRHDNAAHYISTM